MYKNKSLVYPLSPIDNCSDQSTKGVTTKTSEFNKSHLCNKHLQNKLYTNFKMHGLIMNSYNFPRIYQTLGHRT